jgi:PRMT5 arginine-N-methyltransferase
MDNLQSMTYQTFEQDPVKYRNYEEVSSARVNGGSISNLVQAIYRALLEWPSSDRMYVLNYELTARVLIFS